MRTFVWIVLTTVGLAVAGRSARADDPPASPVPEATPAAVEPKPAEAPPVAAETAAMPEAPPIASEAVAETPAPSCGANGCSTCNTADCGKRQRKIARFLDFLIYVPEDRKTTCHKCCDSCPPPAWAFFPCEGRGCCNTCVAGTSPLYYAKAPGATTSNRVMQSAYPPPRATPMAAQAPAAAPMPMPVQAPASATVAAPVSAQPAAPTAGQQPTRISSYNAQNVSAKMPILDPTQFRKQLPDGN